MSRRKKQDDAELELPSLFDEAMQTAQVFSREDVQARHQQEEPAAEYSPTQRTADYAHRAIQFEAAWETTIQKARESLLKTDARQIYADFLDDIVRQINSGGATTGRLSELLEAVAIRGFGMTREEVRVERPAKGAMRFRAFIDIQRVQRHLQSHIEGQHFLNLLDITVDPWEGQRPLIGASDVSQHRSAVPVPARFFKRKVPFVLNNAAGTLYDGIVNGKPKYTNVINPKPDDALLRWMLIDPSYQDELEPEDYERCIASAMDIGQYKFDLEYLLKADMKPPSVIFRDGSLFPQDAYLDNFVIHSKRGEFTREAIKELLNCLLYVRELGVIYCGVTKNVQLKVYSAVTDWYIARHIDPNWHFGNYTLNDGQAMTLLLSSPSFVGDSLQQVISTCLIRRSFTTRANLNTKADLSNLAAYFHFFSQQHPDIDVTPFRRLCELAHVYMLFIGHSKSPQQQLPRYEFYHDISFRSPQETARRILAALAHCSLMNDQDHSFMAEDPVTYLMPSVTQQAHLLSKQVGSYIDQDTKQWIMSRYRNLIR